MEIISIKVKIQGKEFEIPLEEFIAMSDEIIGLMYNVLQFEQYEKS